MLYQKEYIILNFLSSNLELIISILAITISTLTWYLGYRTINKFFLVLPTRNLNMENLYTFINAGNKSIIMSNVSLGYEVCNPHRGIDFPSQTIKNINSDNYLIDSNKALQLKINLKEKPNLEKCEKDGSNYIVRYILYVSWFNSKGDEFHTEISIKTDTYYDTQGVVVTTPHEKSKFDLYQL